MYLNALIVFHLICVQQQAAILDSHRSMEHVLLAQFLNVQFAVLIMFVINVLQDYKATQIVLSSAILQTANLAHQIILVKLV